MIVFPFGYERDSWIICQSLTTHGICVSVCRRCTLCYDRLLAPIQQSREMPLLSSITRILCSDVYAG